jgi:hypothetical protein
MMQMVKIRLKAEWLVKHGLEDRLWPVRMDVFEMYIQDGGVLPYAAFIEGLLWERSEPDVDLPSIERAMDRLNELRKV